MLAIEEIKKITPSNLPALTILTGDDLGQFELLKEQFLRQIQFQPGDLNTAIFDMKEANYQDVELDLVSLPFFTDEKIVILDHFADLTTAKKRYLTDEELKSFESYLENPADTTRLVIFAEGKLDSKRRLVKLLKRDGRIFEAEELKEADLRAYFSKEAQAEGLQFAPAAFDQLLLKSGFQFSEVSKNLDFLKGYKESGQIGLEDIAEAIPKTLQDNIFDLTQLILQQKIDEIKLIAIMLGQFRIFTQVKVLAENGRAESQIVSDLSDYLGRKVNPYQVKFALKDARSLSLAFLKKTMACLIETDYQIKSGLYDKDYLFDLALLKIATGELQAK